MPKTHPSPEELLALLEQAVLRVASATKGVAAVRLQTVPDGDEWSPNDVLAHMRSCADVWGDCIRTILNKDGPTIRAVNPRTWIRDTNYPRMKFGPSFRAFTEQRAHVKQIERMVRT